MTGLENTNPYYCLFFFLLLLYIVSESIAVIAWLLGRRSNTLLMWEWGCTDTICCLWVRCPSDGAVAADSTCLWRFSVNWAGVWLKTWDKTVDYNSTFICKSLTSYFHSASAGWYKMFVCRVYKWSLTLYVHRFSLELWSWSSMLCVSLWQLYGIYCFLMLMVIGNEDFWTRWKTWLNMRQTHHIFFEQKQMWGTCLVGVCQGVRGSAEVKTYDLYRI